MNIKIKSVTTMLVVVLAFIGLCSGILVYQHLYSKKAIDTHLFHGTYLETPRALNAFNLMGIDQKPFNNQSLVGHWTVIFFGFTQCGYVCPTTMAELGKMYRILEKKGIKNLPQMVMISVDPQRDTLDKLKHYVTSFHPSFYGARGEPEAIKAMAQEMGVAYEKVINKDPAHPEQYDIQHSGTLMLFNPEGRLQAFFTTPHDADLLAQDYLLLIA